MESVNVPTAKPGSSVRPPVNPLRWIGADRVLCDDITVYGLRRWVVARHGEPPEVADLLEIVAGITQAVVYAWCVERVVNGEAWWFLWIVWKETR